MSNTKATPKSEVRSLQHKYEVAAEIERLLCTDGLGLNKLNSDQVKRLYGALLKRLLAHSE